MTAMFNMENNQGRGTGRIHSTKAGFFLDFESGGLNRHKNPKIRTKNLTKMNDERKSLSNE